MLSIIDAYINGKTIEVKTTNGTWEELTDDRSWFRMNPDDYRVKQEPTYRPFKNAKECFAEMNRHHPFGWIKTTNEYPVFILINYLSDEGCSVKGYSTPVSFETLFNYNVFADGKPFGIKEE